MENKQKYKTMIKVYTTQQTKISPEEIWLIDYFDDNNGLVWLKKEGNELPAGDTFVTINCFNSFFRKK